MILEWWYVSLSTKHSIFVLILIVIRIQEFLTEFLPFDVAARNVRDQWPCRALRCPVRMPLLIVTFAT